jgi:signal transduction histidine kinase
LERNAAAELGEQIRQAIEAPFEIAGRICNVSASVGIAVVDQSGGLEPGRAADMAMYSAMSTIGSKQKAEDQRQKMEALGRMMGGVAHEINNMLQPVTLLGQDLLDTGQVTEDGRLHLETMVDCTRKAREIIGDVLAFSRPTPRTAEIHDPAVLLDDSLRLVRQAMPANLTLMVRVAGHPPNVRINRTTFVQILLNLATNAAAAMDGQGELTILLDVDAPGPDAATTRTQSGFVRLRVIDTGCGMDKTTMERAFEPFFTTKLVGQGTGLGLPVVYGMVQEVGGTISLDSRPGRGTTVTILIPGQHGTTDGNNTGN